jgi:hypothetical protein
MGTRFLDALTHSGPGYECNQENTWTTPQNGTARLLNALTHSGPGYSLPSMAEQAEIAKLKQSKQSALIDALLEGFEKFFYAEGQLEALAKAKSATEKRERLEAAEAYVREYIQHADGPVALALDAALESLGPLDLRSKVTLLRLQHLSRKLRNIADSILHNQENSGKPREEMAHKSQVAVRRATRSMEVVLCHATAR